MSFLIKNYFKSIIFIFIFGFLYADCNSSGHEDFCISEESFNEDRIVSFYVSSFDFNTGESNIDFFRYRIVRDYDQIDPPTLKNLLLDYTISIYSPSMGFHSQTDIFKGTLKIIGVDRDVIVHNSDFSIYTDAISGFRVIPQIDSYPSQSVMDNMLSTIMQTGKLPDGNYSFKVDLYKENDTRIIDSIERSIEVYSPIFLELVTPGGNLADTTETKIFSTYPVFQWVTDYCPDCNYGIRVCEFSPEQHSSLSEALDDVSSIPLSQSDDFYEIGNINSFQYPTSGVIDLQPGKYYAWQIQRVYQSSIGAENSLSNIYLFKVESPGVGNGGALEMIITLIGENKYNELFGRDGELKGYKISGGSIWVNGEEIPANQLNQIASQIQQGLLKVKEVEVE